MNTKNITKNKRNANKKIKIAVTPESYLRHFNIHKGNYSIVGGRKKKNGGGITCCGGPNVKDIPTDKLNMISKFNTSLLSKIPFK